MNNRHARRALAKIARTKRLTPRGRNKAVQKLLGVDALVARDVLAAAPIVPHKSALVRAGLARYAATRAEEIQAKHVHPRRLRAVQP